MYLETVPARDTICVSIEGAKNVEEGEKFAWDKLNTIVHEAALVVIPNSKSKRVSKILKDKVTALYVYFDSLSW